MACDRRASGPVPGPPAMPSVPAADSPHRGELGWRRGGQNGVPDLLGPGRERGGVTADVELGGAVLPAGQRDAVRRVGAAPDDQDEQRLAVVLVLADSCAGLSRAVIRSVSSRPHTVASSFSTPNTMLPPCPFANAATVLNTVRFDSSLFSGGCRLNSTCWPSPWASSAWISDSGSSGISVSTRACAMSAGARYSPIAR